MLACFISQIHAVAPHAQCPLGYSLVVEFQQTHVDIARSLHKMTVEIHPSRSNGARSEYVAALIARKHKPVIQVVVCSVVRHPSR